MLACQVVDTDEADGWCRRCGCEGLSRDTVVRRLAHEPLGWRPTTLLVTIRRYRCTAAGTFGARDTSKAAEPRAKLSRRGLRWALEGIVCQHLTVARVAEGLAVAWNTANDAVLAEGKRVLIDDPSRFDGVNVIGVDEHVGRHTRRGDKYVTVIIDLTVIRDGTGPARLLDLVEGRSKQVFKTWLAERAESWRERVEVVAMDGFTGFKTAAADELPDAVAVMDPFCVVRMAGDALDECRRRVQQAIHGLRYGRQYLRPLDIGGTLTPPPSGGILGWSRILGPEEALVVANTNGVQPAPRARVLVDANLNQADGTMTVVASTVHSADPAALVPHAVGTSVPIEKDPTALRLSRSSSSVRLK